jgi:pimeloyl-ACP methyl ester carboxylesterase
VKLLLLHGGPAATHEYFEAFDSYLPGAGVEYYYYDQLGSFYSDRPDDDSLYELPRFVDEVEQVRKALELHRDNFCLLGHSWGGILAIEYALAYQQQLKGLIISNMTSSTPACVEYANTVLVPAMDQQVLAEVRALEAKARIGDEYSGDGAMRQLAPTAPALHLGATRILVIGAAWSSGEASRARPNLAARGRQRSPKARACYRTCCSRAATAGR